MRARRNNMIHNIPRKQWDTAYFWGRESIQKGRISQEELSFGLPRNDNIMSKLIRSRLDVPCDVQFWVSPTFLIGVPTF